MTAVATTKMSSKGQVVIPDNIREALGLKKGTQFVVISSQDAVVLKPIIVPSPSEFEELLEKARKSAKKAGLKKSDVQQAIKEVRQARRKK